MPRDGDDLPLLDPSVLMSAAGARELRSAQELLGEPPRTVIGRVGGRPITAGAQVQVPPGVFRMAEPSPDAPDAMLYMNGESLVAVDSSGNHRHLFANEPDVSDPSTPDPALESMFMDELPAYIRSMETHYPPGSPIEVEQVPVHFDQDFGGAAPIEGARFQVGRQDPPARPFMGGAPQSQDGRIVARMGADGRMQRVAPPRMTTPAVAPRTRVGSPVPRPSPIARPVPVQAPPAAPAATVQGPSLWQRLAADED
jgi:hypothetical protein